MGCSGCGHTYQPGSAPPQQVVQSVPTSPAPGKQRQFIGAAFKPEYIQAVLSEDAKKEAEAVKALEKPSSPSTPK